MSFRQITITAEYSWGICKPIAGLRMLPDEFTRRFGVSFIDTDFENGLGDVKAALVETSSGRRFGLIHYVYHPEPRGIAVWAHERSPDPVADVRDFIEAFGLARSDLLGVYGDPHPSR